VGITMGVMHTAFTNAELACYVHKKKTIAIKAKYAW